ncbi:MAG: AEC family transporter, partial [Candidatus Contendobacter sp.]|nr:AEC family transporter [Candidatus Contendobacter sp.]
MTDIPLILGALGPVFGLILIGFGLRRSGFPGDGFWPAAERLTYFILFPALLIQRLALSRIGDYAVLPVATVIIALLLTMTGLVYLLRPWFKVDGPAFTSVYQGVIRFNTYVGLAVALAVFNTEGGAVAALVMAIMIPAINVLCVLML